MKDKEYIVKKLIEIFKFMGYDFNENTHFKNDLGNKRFGMIEVGILGNEIEYEFSLITTVADLKKLFNGTLGDMADWLHTKLINKKNKLHGSRK